jgi:hypothetical protein
LRQTWSHRNPALAAYTAIAVTVILVLMILELVGLL